MSSLSHLTIPELQDMNECDSAIMELGRRVLNFDFCLNNSKYCVHKMELEELQYALENEVPPECPNCGNWITEL